MRIDLSWADLVGGRLSLDFINTRGDRLSEAPNEHLLDYATLLAWAQHAGAVDGAAARRLAHKAAASPRAAAAALAEALALREAIYRLLTGERGAAAADLAVVNEALARAWGDPHVGYHNDRYEVGFRSSDELTAPLDPIVRDAVSLLADPADAARVRSCESDSGCGWIFLDTTKSRTRRWCDMKVCGNRAKAKRHYERRKGAG